ncbi:MAGa3780 family membrane protein [[Mycoplasma] collis]|uniref:MAGa3780 family membrane protein n=1 Tax=[Mycoplasma] collis TaxID=2127 RepID=UPI00051B46D9|nr:hypothetical protein [[Mycoplasma] collis]
MKDKIKNKFIDLNKKQNKILLIFGLIVLFLTICSLLKNIILYEPYSIHKKIVDIDVVFGQWTTFFYFTYQTNFLLAFAILSVALLPNSMKAKQFLFATVSLISITFLVYWTLIALFSNWTNVYSAITSINVHFINPVLGFISLFLLRRKILITKKVIFIASIYFFSYFIFQAILFSSTLGYWEYMNKKGEVIKFYDGVSIYRFSNFLRPFMYKGKNFVIIIFFDLILFTLAVVTPLLTSLFWFKFYKIKIKKIPKKNKKILLKKSF